MMHWFDFGLVTNIMGWIFSLDTFVVTLITCILRRNKRDAE